MDAEINAVKRILDGTWDMTIHMDLRDLATTAIDEACHMARGEKVNVNAEFKGYYSEEEIYGKKEH